MLLVLCRELGPQLAHVTWYTIAIGTYKFAIGIHQVHVPLLELEILYCAFDPDSEPDPLLL